MSLRDDFIAPPLSVLDSRQGYWRERKAAWRAMGLAGGDGRPDELLADSHPIPDGAVSGCSTMMPTTSIFDPVLAQLLIEWFCPPGGDIIDPFAGGPTRGVVASVLGRRYTGIDISGEQVDADVEEAQSLRGEYEPRYLVGDSAQLVPQLDECDMVLTCPPYYGLERYTDDPRDLSTMTPEAFARSYADVLAACSGRMRPGALAALVVGDARDGHGDYLDLPGLTVDCGRRAGLTLYNRMTYIQPYGTAPLRCARTFRASQKVTSVSEMVIVLRKPGEVRRIPAPMREPGDVCEQMVIDDIMRQA